MRVAAEARAKARVNNHPDVPLATDDPVLDWLRAEGHVLSEHGEWIDITCPWVDEHDGDPRPEAGYRPLNENGNRGFRCHHSHGEKCKPRDLLNWVHEQGGPYIESEEQRFERIRGNQSPQDGSDDTNTQSDGLSRAVRDKTIAELAQFSELDYDTLRKEQAKRLGLRVTALDKAVREHRGDSVDETGQGTTLTLEDPEPHPHSVDGAELLGRIARHPGAVPVLA